ncbi:hypothetical protein KCP75_23780 [Salmonella enterica subsp. enterica]|nr:hypothetical protein KCP75_23780 [Salmonella enterica subsp. enterica]
MMQNGIVQGHLSGNITLSEFFCRRAKLYWTEYHENDFSARQQFDVGRMTTQVATRKDKNANLLILPLSGGWHAAA